MKEAAYQVKLSDLDDDVRIDAEYYSPQNMFLAEELKLLPSVNLGNIASITDGQHGYFLIDEKSEIRQITAKCIRGGLVDKTSADRLSQVTHNKNLRSSLQSRDVLVSTVGTVGAIGIVTDDIPPANIDQNVGRITLTNNVVSPYFLWGFLQSKFGQYQIERYTTGQVQMHLSLRKLKGLRIPLLERQKEVDEIVLRFISKNEQATRRYKLAQDYLEIELGFEEFKKWKQVGYSAQFSDLIDHNRIDADYYQKFYLKARELIKNYSNGYGRLMNYLDLIKPNFNPKGKQRQQLDYIELADVNSTIGLVNTSYSYYGLDLPTRARRQVTEGDVLASSVVGSLEKTALIDQAFDGCIASTGFFHLRPINVSPQFLLVLLRSKAVTMQFEQEATGGILSAMPESGLQNIIVPVVPLSLQEEITGLVVEAHQSRRESERLLLQAKALVEQIIEEEINNETLN